MPEVFRRIDAELTRQGQTDAWLARQLGIERAAIANWRRRGVVPKGRYDEIAVALGQSADWLAGRAPARETDLAALSPMALRIAQEFDRIADPEKQLQAFATCIQTITRAAS